MSEQRSNGHTVSRLTGNIVWCTKYWYSIFKWAIQMCCRTLLIQICESENLRILKRIVSKGPHSSAYRIRFLSKCQRSSEKIKMPWLSKPAAGVSWIEEKILGRHFWVIGCGCWSTGDITDEMAHKYLEHLRRSKYGGNDNFILEEWGSMRLLVTNLNLRTLRP